MKISIICVGKMREKFYRDALAEYAKRLSRYCRLEILEVEDEMTPDGASQALEEQIKLKEAKKLLSGLREDAYTIALEIQGRKMNSVEFAGMIDRLGVQGKSHIQFVIGGSLGLHESVTRLAHFHLSFSDMTFPHQLMRVILLEQIYRGYRIIGGEPYHK